MPANPMAGARCRILVVEDEYLVATHVATVLEDLGYEVVGLVPTVAEAMTVIASEKPDAVLLDANLGGVSSAPIAAELAAQELPFVVVTGYGDLALGPAGSALQAAPRISKPFSPAGLAAVLAKAMAA